MTGTMHHDDKLVQKRQDTPRPPSLDSSVNLAYEDNIPIQDNAELSRECVSLFLDFFGEELCERCSDLCEGIDRSAG